ncbi:MAG: MmgE/PrpD family protein [Chloroflexi bacterium]|nr:MmgE/PrpD family protein [Chloroflexota bacterium]
MARSVAPVAKAGGEAAVEATRLLAEFIVGIRYQDVPARAVELAKRSAVDCVAAALAGCTEPVGTTITRYVSNLGGAPQAAVIKAGFRAAVPDAALANGTMAHALDYDDGGARVGHPSVLVFPAALSLGDYLLAPGRDVLAAYILGLEVQGKVALSSSYKAGQGGFDHHGFYGALGATAVAASLLRLDVDQIRTAFGIAAGLACGLSANHGTQMEPMVAGNACRNGIMAALLAREGITAASDIIESKEGLCYSFMGPGKLDAELLARKLGGPFYVESPGLGLKKYPSCMFTHRVLDALLQLVHDQGLTPDNVAEVEVGTSAKAQSVLAFDEPATGYQGKFSMQHCVACGLVDGEVSLSSFTEAKVRDPLIAEMRRKVRLTYPDLPLFPGLTSVEPGRRYAGNPVTVRLKDGRTYTAQADVLRGDPEVPLEDDDLRGKFTDCAHNVLSAEDIQRSLHMLFHLDEMPNVRALTDILMAPGAANR